MSKRLCSVTVQLAPAPSFAELVSVIIDGGGTLEGEPVVMRFPDGSAYAIQAYWLPEDWDKPPPAFDEEAEPVPLAALAADFVGVDRAEAGADESVTDEADESGSWAGVNDYPTPIEELASFEAQVIDLFAELRADLDFLGWASAPPSGQMLSAISRIDGFEWLQIRATGGADVMAAACLLKCSTLAADFRGRPAPKYLAK